MIKIIIFIAYFISLYLVIFWLLVLLEKGIKTKPKKRRRGRIVGETSWMKKAIITLKDDQVIDSIMKIYS